MHSIIERRIMLCELCIARSSVEAVVKLKDMMVIRVPSCIIVIERVYMSIFYALALSSKQISANMLHSRHSINTIGLVPGVSRYRHGILSCTSKY